MNNWIFIVVLLGALVLVIGGFAVRMARKQRELLKKYPGYPKGYFQSQGMGVGIAIGAGIGVAMQNIAIGVGLGIAIGAAIGARKEAQHKDEIRPLTEEEKELKRQKMIFTSAILIVGLLVFVLSYLMSS